jgi:hypothetical protein
LVSLSSVFRIAVGLPRCKKSFDEKVIALLVALTDFNTELSMLCTLLFHPNLSQELASFCEEYEENLRNNEQKGACTQP